ncbi:MAG: lytic transglycosylase domain-containing protein, partial [Vicinamibacterales bacterium]
GLLGGSSASSAAQSQDRVPGVPGDTVAACEERWLRFASVRRLHHTLHRQLEATDIRDAAGAWTDLTMLAEAVAGPSLWPEISCAAENSTEVAIPATTAPPVEVAHRDRAGYDLLALGYSARETADILSGRITRAALDTARRLIMAGRGREAAETYLSEQYREARAVAERARALAAVPVAAPNRFDPLIEFHAQRHGVSAALVRAVIQVESAFAPLARSRTGAAGLMQLMPATARALGVDPWNPEQNVDGGVRYLSSLLREFGTTELALVAYNGGPGFARRYVRGETALYGETRAYVRRVAALLGSTGGTPIR